MGITVNAQPLTKQEFEPYGDVIEHSVASQDANYGQDFNIRNR